MFALVPRLEPGKANEDAELELGVPRGKRLQSDWEQGIKMPSWGWAPAPLIFNPLAMCQAIRYVFNMSFEIPSPYDVGFKTFFQDQDLVRDFINHYIPDEIKSYLDLSVIICCLSTFTSLSWT